MNVPYAAMACAISLWLAACGAPGVASSTPNASASTDAAGAAPSEVTAGCLATGNGYVRAKLRGALDMDLAWRNDEMECTGGARPDGQGLRVSFAGPIHSDGRRLRLVFGIQDAPEGLSGRARPTNLTVIFEGEKRLFATRGDDKCTVDDLQQQRIGALGGKHRTWRVVARGFCIEPATVLNGDERLLMTTFDFAGQVSFDDDTSPSAASPSGATSTDPIEGTT